MTCRFFANGTCKYGDDCRFLHTAEHPEATARHTTSSHKSRNLIWDKRDTDTPAILEALRTAGSKCNPVDPVTEVARHTTCRKLRNTLRTACAKIGIKVPLLCFERWLCRCKLYERDHPDEVLAPGELLLPSTPWIDDAFLRDLQRGGCTADAARALVNKLTQQSLRGLERMRQIHTGMLYAGLMLCLHVYSMQVGEKIMITYSCLFVSRGR
eukprot:m.363023 g.363023  ORF g.363023 m.363023 type:complete len:212 (+) comp20797_c0_seq5:1385-2020(+)